MGRIASDKIDAFGKVTIRYLGKLRHIAVEAVHRNRKVTLLVAGADVRIVTDDGELLRTLTLDASRVVGREGVEPPKLSRRFYRPLGSPRALCRPSAK